MNENQKGGCILFGIVTLIIFVIEMIRGCGGDGIYSQKAMEYDRTHLFKSESRQQKPIVIIVKEE